MSDVTVRVAEEPIQITISGGMGPSEFALWLAENPGGTLGDFLNRNRKAVLVNVYGQSLSGPRTPAVTLGEVPGLLMFSGGYDKELFDGWTDSAGELVADVANFSTLVPYQPSASTESMTAGIGIRVLEEEGVALCLPFRMGVGSESARLLHLGTENFEDMRSALTLGVRHLEALDFYVEIRNVFNHGHGNADQLNDGGGMDETETTVAEYKNILTKMHADFTMVARAATGRPISPTTWITPLLSGSGGGQYTSVGLRQVQEGQRQAVRDVAGIRYGAGYSQWPALFETDLVHPNGVATRYKAEADALFMRLGDFVPPQMTAKNAVNATTTDVTFNQAVQLSVSQTDATGYADAFKGFELFIGATQYAVTNAVVQGDGVTVRLTHASCSTTGREVRNGQQWIGSNQPSATHMPRTHIAGMVNIGTAEDGTALINYSIPQAI